MEAKLKPKPLEPGDLIRIVSPASPIPPEKLVNAVKMLEGEGYRIELADHVHDEWFYLAGKDEDRAQDLQKAFDDPDVHAVYCSRGGYGCARLLPYLNIDAMARSRKMFLGFSDITTLHLALNRRGLVTFHAPMALSFNADRPDWVRESLLRNLKGDSTTPSGAPVGETLIEGKIEGEVTGGCLCLLTDSLATPDSLSTKDRIVLIEDVDENPHRVDAMLTHLHNASLLQDAAGFVIGEMTNTDDREDATIGKRGWREIVEDRLLPLGKTTIVNYPFGHMKAMLTLPLGVRAELDGRSGTLSYLESPCA